MVNSILSGSSDGVLNGSSLKARAVEIGLANSGSVGLVKSSHTTLHISCFGFMWNFGMLDLANLYAALLVFTLFPYGI